MADIKIPRSRVGGFSRPAGRLMGPGPDVRKPGPVPSEDVFQFGPIGGLGFSSFTEIFRRVLTGFAHGKITVGADTALGPTSLITVAPFLYVDVQIIGWTNGVAEVLAYGATGQTLSAGTPITQDNGNMDAPVVQTTWDDSFAFDEVSVGIRTMGQGGVPFDNNVGAPLWLNVPGDFIKVNIAGKLWR